MHGIHFKMVKSDLNVTITYLAQPKFMQAVDKIILP